MPVLKLTARYAIADRVAGFEHGADDYLVEPFAVAELVARVRALCRLREQPASARIILGDIDITLARRRVQRAGVLRSLSPKEFAVLELLATRTGSVVSRSGIGPALVAWNRRIARRHRHHGIPRRAAEPLPPTPCRRRHSRTERRHRRSSNVASTLPTSRSGSGSHIRACAASTGYMCTRPLTYGCQAAATVSGATRSVVAVR